VDKSKRYQLMDFLNKNGIGTGIHYPKPIYQQKLYQEMGFAVKCDEAENASSEVLSLPVHPSLKHEDLEVIVNVLEKASKELL